MVWYRVAWHGIARHEICTPVQSKMLQSTALNVSPASIQILVETFQSVLLSTELDYLRTFYMLGTSLHCCSLRHVTTCLVLSCDMT